MVVADRDGIPIGIELPVLVVVAARRRAGLAADAVLEVVDGGDRVHRLSHPRGETVEAGRAQSAGNAAALEVDGPADGVALFLVLVCEVTHLFCGVGVRTPNLVFLRVFENLLETHVGGLDITELADVSLDFDIVLALFEDLLGDATGGDPVDRLAGGGAPATAPVSRPELRGVGEITVRGPWRGDERFVLARAGVFVLDDHPDGRARGVAVLNAGLDRDLVGFPARGGNHRLAGLAAVEVCLDVVLVEFDTRGNPRDRTAHRLPVALTERRESEEPTETVAVHYHTLRDGAI